MKLILSALLFTALTQISYAMPSKPQTLEMQKKQAQAVDPVVSCRSKLRKAGLLAKGKGAGNKNHMAVDACVRNGGRI